MSQDAKLDQDTSADPTLDEGPGNDVIENDGIEDMGDDAASSPATKGETDDRDLLSVVRDVVPDEEEQTDGEQTASPAEGEESTEETPEEGEAPAEPDDEDYTDVPFHKHPRFQQLLRKSKAFEQDASQYQKIQNFMDTQGLVPEEAADLLIIGGLMKTNPVEAWNRMKPAVQKLLIAAGEVLPDDLQQRVAKREISREAAVEISRLRAKQQSQTTLQSFEQQRQEQQRQQAAAQALNDAAISWANDRQRKDPNFSTKVKALEDAVAVLWYREGKPNTPEGVKAQLDKAYKTLAAPAQAKPAPRPAQRQNASGQVAGNPRPAAKSMMDIIDSVVEA